MQKEMFAVRTTINKTGKNGRMETTIKTTIADSRPMAVKQLERFGDVDKADRKAIGQFLEGTDSDFTKEQKSLMVMSTMPDSNAYSIGQIIWIDE